MFGSKILGMFSSPPRKMRWYFEGKDNAGAIVFPGTFVKVDLRPAYPYLWTSEGQEHVPSELTFWQYFCMYDEPDRAKAEFETFAQAAPQVTQGKLTVYTGAGEVFEEWTMNEAKLILTESDLGDGENIVAHWQLRYQKCDYVSPMYKPTVAEITPTTKTN